MLCHNMKGTVQQTGVFETGINRTSRLRTQPCMSLGHTKGPCPLKCNCNQGQKMVCSMKRGLQKKLSSAFWQQTICQFKNVLK
jgi:hypothetical protein